MHKRSAWPVREDGWEERLAVRVRDLLNEVAERHSLSVGWAETDLVPLDVSCTFPSQPGLDFELWFALGTDEMTFGGGDWYADIFPADDDEKWSIIRQSIDGLITGEARIARFFAPGWARPFWTELQLHDGVKWRAISTGVGCAIPPIYRTVIMRNGHPTETAGIRPAWGSLALLLGIAAGGYWLFS